MSILWSFMKSADPAPQQQATPSAIEDVCEMELESSDDEAVCVIKCDPQLREYKTQNRTLKTDNEALQKKISELEATHKKEISVKDRQIQEKESKVREHELRLQQARQEHERVKNTLRGKEDEARLLEDRVSALRKELEAKETWNGEAVKHLSALKSDVAKSESLAKSLANQRDQASEELRVARAEVDQLKSMQHNFERKICNLELTLQSSMEEISQLKSSIERLKGELTAAKANHLKEIENTKAMYSKNSSHAQDLLLMEQQRLTAAFAQTTTQIEVLQRESIEVKGVASRMEAERNAIRKRMEDDAAAAAAKLRELDEETKQLRNQLGQEKRNKENAFASYESSQRVLGSLQAKTHEFEKLSNELRLKLHAAVTQKEDLENRLAKSETAASELLCVKSDLEFMNQQVAAKNKENDNLRSEIQKLQMQAIDIETKDAEIARLRRQLEESNRKMAEMERNVQEMTGNLPSVPTPRISDEDSKEKNKKRSIVDKYPGRVAIKCIKGDNCPYLDLLKFKYAVPAEYTKNKFESFVRGKLVLEDSPIVLRIKSLSGELIPFPENVTMGTVFAQHEYTDGTVNIVYNAI